ncbi:MAG TPA: antibiotic biosynthesis monooxygenase [Streptosporangiaceae bacterium]|nr:antibiotic biosynthesis monooxygenase [Streptosporangiaceae bacterium]
MISLVVSGIGAVVAAVGSGVLLARCFREPRADLVAWSIALLGLLVSLGSQALGYLAGFDSAMFRGMEIGGQVIAPLALILGLSEVAAKRTAVRFCARLYIPALAIVAVVILGLDQLGQTTFSKAWPDPAVFYQLPPDYVLMFGIGPLTALVTVIAVWSVTSRSSQPGWDGVLRPQLMAAIAAMALAYPCLAQLIAYKAGIHLPVSSLFAVLCTVAAGLTWAAGSQTGRLSLAALQGRSTGEAGLSRDDAGRGRYRDDDAERGRYRDDGEHWQDRAGQAARSQPGERDSGGYGWRDDRNGEADGRDWRDFATGDFATGDLMPGDFATGDHDLGYQPSYGGADGHYGNADGHYGYGPDDGHYRPDDDEYRDHDAREDPLRDDQFRGDPLRDDRFRDDDDHYGLAPARPGGWAGEPGSDRDRLSGGPARAATETRQEQLFGQIAIYTVLEDRVDEFDQLTAQVVEQVRSREPDTLVFIVHAVPSAPMQRILYEVYRDREAYQWHIQQPYVRQFEADRRPYVLATNVIELGLQQAKVSPFPSVADLFGEPGYDTSGFERPDFLRDYGRTSGQRDSSSRGGDYR